VEKYNNINKLKTSDISTLYKQNLNSEIRGTEKRSEKSINEYWHVYKVAITTAAEETSGEMDKMEVKDWFDDQCEVVIREKNEVYVRMLQRSSTRGLTEEYRNKRRKEKVHRRKKHTYENQLIKDIEELRNKNESGKFYKLVKTERKAFKPRVTMCKDMDGNIITGKIQILYRWVEYFDELLNRNVNTHEESATEEVDENYKPTEN
jgi:hypothetical protein